jgi:hypothetical protein
MNGTSARIFAAALAVAFSWGPAAGAQPAARPGVGLTVYSSADPAGFDPQRFVAQQRAGAPGIGAEQVPGFAVVRDVRELDLVRGTNTVRFTDVAQHIDPTSVSLTDLSAGTAESVRVLEQSFQFDLVSPARLLERYLDQPVTVNLGLGNGQVERVSGTLLSSTREQLVIRTDTGLRLLPAGGDVQLGDLPRGLNTRPTLQWLLAVPQDGRRLLRTTYQTDGLSWRADYNLVLSPDETRADLGAWVTLLNLSGAGYRDANLKLVAGDVQRVQPPRPEPRQLARATVELAVEGGAISERPFYEYHLYTLSRPTTVEANSTQQLALFPTVQGVAVEKSLVYYGLPEARFWVFPDPRVDRELGLGSQEKVDVYLRLDNSQQNRLGIPMPRGKVRVFKVDEADGSLEFVGEDLIDHKAKNEQVLIKTGQSFDVTGDRVQTDFAADSHARWIQESVRVTLRNAKDRPQKVVVRENLYRWSNWVITRKSDEYTKVDSRTVHFEVEVPADGSRSVDYTVRYSW